MNAGDVTGDVLNKNLWLNQLILHNKTLKDM